MKAQRILLGMALAFGAFAVPAASFGQVADSPVAAARRQLTEAETAVTTAKTAMDRARVRVALAFKTQNPDYAKAEAEAIKAKAEIESAKAGALTAVRAKPEYVAAVNAKATVQSRMRELQQAGGSQADFNKLAEESIKHSTLITTMERTAVENDAKYADAVSRLAEANKVIEGFKPQVDEACAADPDYMALVMQYEQAVQTVDAAKEQMKQAALAAQQQRAAEAKAKADERKAKSKSN